MNTRTNTIQAPNRVRANDTAGIEQVTPDPVRCPDTKSQKKALDTRLQSAHPSAGRPPDEVLPATCCGTSVAGSRS